MRGVPGSILGSGVDFAEPLALNLGPMLKYIKIISK
jgi:hypothetical protein